MGHPRIKHLISKPVCIQIISAALFEENNGSFHTDDEDGIVGRKRKKKTAAAVGSFKKRKKEMIDYLDQTSVHPECYELAGKCCDSQ